MTKWEEYLRIRRAVERREENALLAEMSGEPIASSSGVKRKRMAERAEWVQALSAQTS